VVDSTDQRFTGEVRREDLAEAPRRIKGSKAAGVVKWALIAVVCLVLLILLVRGLQPAMTPEQIVQHESYEGEQPARRIFNLNSARQEENEAQVPSSQPRANTPQSESATATEQVAKVAEDEGNRVSGEPGTVVPAVSSTDDQSSTPEAEPVPERVRVVLEAPVSEEAQGTPRMLPSYAVVGDNVPIYERPARSARIIASVAGDSTVTVFNSDGAWAQVAANDGSGVTGYVQRSSITEIER